MSKAVRFLLNEDGVSAIVYALILMLAVLAFLTIITLVGQSGAGRP